MALFRPYVRETDQEAVRRIFHEVHWSWAARHVDDERFGEVVRARVAELDGAAECLVTSCDGTIRHLETDVPFACILGAVTSRVARRQGLALNLLSRTLAEHVADRALVAGLGVFDQGFYDRIGFGLGSYVRSVAFNPADLKTDLRPRPPRRLSPDDWQALHAARLARRLGHGACSLTPPEITRAEVDDPSDSFGLGYFDGPGGTLSHGFWLHGKEEHGPYHVRWVIFHTREQLHELLAVLKGLSDQVHLVALHEPAGIQLQSLLVRPLAAGRITEGSRYANRVRTGGYYQFRVLDVPGCLAQTHLPSTETLLLNVRVTDPIEARLPEGSPWRGCAGNYVASLGESCSAERGEDSSLPTLNATINAFTRLWLGVEPATGLAFTDDLSGPPGLLAALDRVLRLPEPDPDWDF
jgi:hypothetical protein